MYITTTIENKRKWQAIALLFSNILVSIFTLFHESDRYDYVILLLTSSSIAIVEWFLIVYLPQKFNAVVLRLFIVIYVLIFLVQIFLEYYFHMCYCYSVVLLLANTHSDEIRNFLMAYTNVEIIGLLLLIAFFTLVAVIWFSKYVYRQISIRWLYILAVLGFCVYAYCGASMKLTGDAHEISKYSVLTITMTNLSLIKAERSYCQQLIKGGERIKNVNCKWEDKPNVVLVIGESSSIYHSSLYSYDKETSPLIKKWMLKGNLFLYNDAVSITDATITAMESIYSLERHDTDSFCNLTLFPYVFKKAGYNVCLMDNQYFIGEENTFMADRTLSESMFNRRNAHRYQYDGEMVKDLKINNYPTLYIVHLYGQHYTYSERYPEKYSHYKSVDYDKKRWSEKQREVLAHYDNATLYLDAVCNQIIEKFLQTNSCILFLADHGEEVYDIDNFMGHGTAKTTKDNKYQLRVPFEIFLTNEYQKSHPDIVYNVNSSVSKKVVTDDVSQLILDLAGITCNYSQPERSVINSRYVERSRIVLDGISFDD